MGSWVGRLYEIARANGLQGINKKLYKNTVWPIAFFKRGNLELWTEQQPEEKHVYPNS